MDFLVSVICICCSYSSSSSFAQDVAPRARAQDGPSKGPPCLIGADIAESDDNNFHRRVQPPIAVRTAGIFRLLVLIVASGGYWCTPPSCFIWLKVVFQEGYIDGVLLNRWEIVGTSSSTLHG